MKKNPSGAAGFSKLIAIITALGAFSITLTHCARVKKESPRIVLEEGISLPPTSALAWLDETDSPDGAERFISVSSDGITRVWDMYSGLVSVSDGSVSDGPVFDSSVLETVFPVHNPGKIMNLLPAEDGAILLLDTASGKELARYYGFTVTQGGPPEWISVLPNGIYNASLGANSGGGSACLAAEIGGPNSRAYRRYNMARLSGALLRPDLFKETLYAAKAGGKLPETPETLAGLFRDECLPPDVSVSFDNTATPLTLLIKTAAGKGGAGHAALYGRVNGMDIPAGYFDAESSAEKKYSEKGKTCYELNITLGNRAAIPYEELTVSAFNKSDTVESERYKIQLPPLPESGSGNLSDEAAETFSPPRALRALIAAVNAANSGDSRTSGESKDSRESENSRGKVLGECLSLQAEGNLYDNTDVKYLFAGDFTRERFLQTFGEMGKTTGQNDVLVLGINTGARADSGGNLIIMAEKTDKGSQAEISADEILEQAIGLSPAPLLLLFDLENADPNDKLETALLRFRQKMGPKALLASFGPPGEESPLFQTAADLLNGELSGSPLPGGRSSDDKLPGSRSPGAFGEDRYMGAADFIAGAAQALGRVPETARYYDGSARGETFIAFTPKEDFNIADRFLNSGELKFQTMSSGMLKIDRVDKEPIPLIFGNTMVRVLPPGSYIIDMIYRNGYRETKTVELRRKASAWVIFTYTPALLNGDISRLPSFGINLSELNPANYEKVNREAMEGMGMAPYYVAYLAGEKLYKDGDYAKAISEYTRSISLKSDYADAWVSRGNARRRIGESGRAIEDYTRALSLNKGYAETYNYRGYVYAQTGDLARAIEDYTQAIRNKSGYTDAYFNRAYAYAKQGNYDLAIADYTQVIKAEPSNSTAYNERGNAWDRKGDKAKADADYAAAAKLNPR